MSLTNAPTGRYDDRIDATVTLDHERQVLRVGHQAQAAQGFGNHQPHGPPGAHPPVVLVRDDGADGRERVFHGGAADAQHFAPHQAGVARIRPTHEQAIVEGVQLQRVVPEAK